MDLLRTEIKSRLIEGSKSRSIPVDQVPVAQVRVEKWGKLSGNGNSIFVGSFHLFTDRLTSCFLLHFPSTWVLHFLRPSDRTFPVTSYQICSLVLYSTDREQTGEGTRVKH